MKYPRVLYLAGRPIGHQDGIGQTMGTLYRDWPKDSVFQVVLEEGDSSTPPNLVVGDAGVLVRRLRNSIPRSARIVRDAPADAGLPRPILSNPFIRDGRSVKPLSSATWEALCDVSPEWLPGNLLEEVGVFSPQAIHSPLGSIRLMRMAYRLSRRLRIPLVPHFMDDWMPRMFCNGELAGTANRYGLHWARRVTSSAPLLLTIGEAMAREYGTRYSRPAVAVGNSVDPEVFMNVARTRRTTHRAQRQMVYAGGIHLGRADVLIRVANVLRSGAPEWTLHVYTTDGGAQTVAQMRPPPNLVVSPRVPNSDLPRVLVNADALLFVESSDKGFADYTRLSVSTKVPEYLAARVPILAVGPEQQASIRLLEENGAAVVDPEDQGQILNRAQGLLAHPGARPNFPETLTSTWMRERFRQALVRAC